MTAFLIYLLKTTVCLAIFYLFFKTFLSNETLFRFNRKILLIGAIVCFMLPLVKVTVSEPSVIQTPFLFLEESLSTEKIKSTTTKNVYGDISVIFNYAEKKETSHKNLVTYLFVLFFAGLIINTIILGKSFFSMYRLFCDSKIIDYKGHKLIISKREISPFSWHSYIVISAHDFENNSEEIFAHEMAHIRHNHSIDILFFELLVLLQWFNPVIWLLKKELKYIHEYQADSSVLESGINVTKYQLLLVEKAVNSTGHFTFVNKFNSSKIKKRIYMMLKEKSKSRAKWKLVVLAPLLSFVVFMFANPHYYKSPEGPLAAYETILNQEGLLYEILEASPIVIFDTKDNPSVFSNIPDDSDEPFLNNPVTMTFFSKEQLYNINLKFDADESEEKIYEQLSKIDLNKISSINVTVPNNAIMDLIIKIRQLLIDRNENGPIHFIHLKRQH